MTALPLATLPQVAEAANAGSRASGAPVRESVGVPAISMVPPEIATPDIIAANRQLAQVLPESTPMAFFLSTREENWEGLERFALFSKISGFMGGSLTPRSLPFFPPSLQYEFDGDIQSWMGEQAAIAFLPDTTPRSVAVTDIPSKMYMVLPVTDQAALVPFLEALEVSREGVTPEKTVHEGIELWVWPTRTASWDDGADFGDGPEVLPEVAPEAAPETTPNLPDVPLPEAAPQSPSDEGSGMAEPKAVDPDPTLEELPLPEDFGDDEWGTYEVPGLTVAMLGDHLVFAQEAAAVKELIDYQQFEGARLGDSELFLRSQYADTEGAIARFYSNLSEVVKFNLDGTFPGNPFPDGSGFPSPVPLPPGLPDFSTFPGLTLPPEAREMASQTLTGVTLDMLVYPQDEGMRLQGRIYGNGLVQSTATPDLPYADSALAFVPAPTYALSSGRDVAGFWQQIASGLALSEATRPFLEQARTMVSLATGLDLDTELLGWMDREFVLFFFPSNEGGLNSLLPDAGVEIGVAIQTSDRTTAQKALDAIDELVGPYIAVDATVNDTPAVSWQGPNFRGSPEPVSYLSHSWISDDTVLISSGAGAMKRLLNATAFEPVDEHPTFLNATDSLANPNNGYSYLNAGSTLSLIYSQLTRRFGLGDSFFFQQVQSILGTIRGFGATTSSTDEYWQLDSLMNLAPAEQSRTSVALPEPPVSDPPVTIPVEGLVEDDG
ncbi:MAG: DUF3352 domain-containing protein [Cyanobacteria bacterium P01_F01_bin.53]